MRRPALIPIGVVLASLAHQAVVAQYQWNLPPRVAGYQDRQAYPPDGDVARAKALAAGHLRGGKLVLYVPDCPGALACAWSWVDGCSTTRVCPATAHSRAQPAMCRSARSRTARRGEWDRPAWSIHEARCRSSTSPIEMR